LDHFGNKTEIKNKGKYERYFRKESNISKSRECNLPPMEDQTSEIEGISKYEKFTGKGGNEKRYVGKRGHSLSSYSSAYDDGWQRLPKHEKSINQKSGYLKGEIDSSSTFHMVGESVETEAGHSRRHMEGGHQSGGRYAVHAQEPDQGLSQQGVEQKCVLGYKRLEKLADEEPYDILVVLANERYGFETLVKQPLKPDLLVLIVRVLSKLCKADFEENKAAVLSVACVHEFLDQLSEHIALIPLEVDKKRNENVGSFLEDLITFLKTVVVLLPSKAVEGFEKIFTMTDVMIKIFEGQQFASANFDELRKKFEHIKAQHKICIEDDEKKKMKETVNTYALEIPQDDFKEMSVFPNPEDILAEEPGFVRPNIIDGAYESVDHYLDTQFRLLREDFVSPLREGISDYINMTDKRRIKKHKSVRIYHKVVFLCFRVVNGQNALIVCFDLDKHLTKIDWEHSKRLLFGSLLLFSRNNFADIIFGTVMMRSVEGLKNGEIVVRLSEGSGVSSDMFSDEFVMAESQVYFEPYYHVLKALQSMKQTSFPMEKYIVHAQISDAPPKYMCSEGGVLLDIDGRAVCVLQDGAWPGPLELKLDVSQYSAFKSALTKEFVVVQGPPGTGKTFLGLKVATVLLKNSAVWNASRNPILLVCYTNHALDQFLEGLISVTDRIVRVGGQSKSAVLEGFNLREKRKMLETETHLADGIKKIYGRMADVKYTIKDIETDLEMIANHPGIISLSVLQKVGIIQDRHLGCFVSHNYMVAEDLFTEWLEYGMYDDVPPYEEEGNSNENQGHNIDEMMTVMMR
jgi:hypothetical protein